MGAGDGAEGQVVAVMGAMMDVVDTVPQRTEYRCPSCDALLFHARIRLADRQSIEVYCRRCKQIVVFVAARGEAA